MKRLVVVIIAVALLVGGGYWMYAKLQANQNQQDGIALRKQNQDSKAQKTEAKYIANALAQISDAQPILQLADSRAKHRELKELAASYLKLTKTEEVALTKWQKEWSYEDTKPDVNRLPNYVSPDEYSQMKDELANLVGDEFDKLFIEYLRIQTLSDNQQAYKVSADTKHPELKKFADASIQERLKISREQSEWPEQWGYVPSHDG